MNPIPLTAPDGRIYAYACGICHHVAGGSSSAPTYIGPVKILVEDSLRKAAQCCSCWDCSTRLGPDDRLLCAPCEWRMRWVNFWRTIAFCIANGITTSEQYEAAYGDDE